MTEFEDWQLDIIDQVMRRCDAFSDFSAEKFMETLEKLGFTVARRQPIREASTATQNSDVILSMEHVPGKPVIQIHKVKGRKDGQWRSNTWRGPSPDFVIYDEVPSAFFQRQTEEPITQTPCMMITPHEPHEWDAKPNSYRVLAGLDDRDIRRCPGVHAQKWPCDRTDVHEAHQSYSHRFKCMGITQEESNRANAQDLRLTMAAIEEPTFESALELTPIGSTWVRKNPLAHRSNEGQVTEVFFRLVGQKKVFYVGYIDTWRVPCEQTQEDFLELWERL